MSLSPTVKLYIRQYGDFESAAKQINSAFGIYVSGRMVQCEAYPINL